MLLPFSAAFGLIFGSYLNVVIYRLPRGLSTVRPASRCPRCVMPIRPFDNVPVLGYLWLRARCRDCGLPISPRYPLIELTTGLYFAWMALRADGVLEQAAASLFGSWLLVLALIDIDLRRVPVVATVFSTVIAVAVQPWLGWAPIESALLAALAALAGARLVSWLGDLLGIERALGWGDALALALIGAALGPQGLLISVLLAAALASLWYAPRVLFSGTGLFEQSVPWVAFLSFGSMVALLIGPLADGGSAALFHFPFAGS